MASMLEALQPHPEDHLHLRLHRARSVVLTSQELVEIRAAQRTFEGAYMRTALSQFSFALVVLKIFTSDFYPIGALLACYGAAVLLVAVYRRYEGNRQFFDREEPESSSSSSSSDASEESGSVAVGEGEGGEEREGGGDRGRARARGRNWNRVRQVVVKKKFRTSGNSVGLLVGLSLRHQAAASGKLEKSSAEYAD
ncbi:uncharacterized protein B0H64DRAFT_438094 [Chaetomium fimeti]|uniref:DUF202 domain-containing protein n=1 Tax=Chaetomium fimeti TaxID=1854472 RepID=A0AAE0HRA7_9PEZI|nr:hypothetical protein B0H64DRAFT_438094 [Chaetomium fimeti]